MSTFTTSNLPSRNFNNDNDKLNGIIANLRHCDDYHGNIEHDTFDNAIEAIEQLRKERDVLRRELSQVIASYHGENDVDIAKERGWDCFENCTQVEGEWLVNEGKA
jgi:hypothetical protein